MATVLIVVVVALLLCIVACCLCPLVVCVLRPDLRDKAFKRLGLAAPGEKYASGMEEAPKQATPPPPVMVTPNVGEADVYDVDVQIATQSRPSPFNPVPGKVPTPFD